ncbi:MAG: 50S ribosomal protein L3 [Alphaproteobacteria bacterium GM7ARS4]|nr:50S ribosomal protein L3 [Alphaproteobacteria bacterium GM7ARS4]
MRVGLYMRKVGMSRLFSDEGKHIPVTILSLDSCSVVRRLVKERDGVDAVQIGFCETKESRLNKPQRVFYKKQRSRPYRYIRQYRPSEKGMMKEGDELNVDHFIEGQYVDVIGRSIGKGFAGSMKRHHFGGGRASHGVSVSHRAHGSTGQCQEPGRVFKGKKMAGHMGDGRVTVHNVRIIKIDDTQRLIYLKGCVPGSKGRYVELRDACKMPLPDHVPWPQGGSSVSQQQDDAKTA